MGKFLSHRPTTICRTSLYMLNQHPGFDVTKNYYINPKLIKDSKLLELHESEKLVVWMQLGTSTPLLLPRNDIHKNYWKPFELTDLKLLVEKYNTSKKDYEFIKSHVSIRLISKDSLSIGNVRPHIIRSFKSLTKDLDISRWTSLMTLDTESCIFQRPRIGFEKVVKPIIINKDYGISLVTDEFKTYSGTNQIIIETLGKAMEKNKLGFFSTVIDSPNVILPSSSIITKTIIDDIPDNID